MDPHDGNESAADALPLPPPEIPPNVVVSDEVLQDVMLSEEHIRLVETASERILHACSVLSTANQLKKESKDLIKITAELLNIKSKDVHPSKAKEAEAQWCKLMHIGALALDEAVGLERHVNMAIKLAIKTARACTEAGLNPQVSDQSAFEQIEIMDLEARKAGNTIMTVRGAFAKAKEYHNVEESSEQLPH